MSRNRLWVIGIALVAVAVLLLGWVLGVQPQLNAAAKNDRDREAVDAVNAGHEAELAALIVQYKNIDDVRAVMEELRGKLPPWADSATFLRQLNETAAASGVSVTSVTLSAPAPFVPAVTEVVPPPVTEGTDAAEPTANVAAAEPAPTESVVPVGGLVTEENFITIPLTVEVAGDRPNILQFTQSMQFGKRLLLLKNFVVTQEEGAAATEETPAGPSTYAGQLTGLMYVLLDPHWVVPVEGDLNGDGVVDESDEEPVEVVVEPTPTPTPTEEPAE